MRLWHYKLLPYLPELQFKGQLREMVSILHDLKRNGKTNHLLINRIMEYPKEDFYGYFLEYAFWHEKRYGVPPKQSDEFREFGNHQFKQDPFNGWHTKEYLRMNMSNLAEKHFYGIGKSRITDEEWQRLCEGYKKITGEEYKI
jgi:hypothetical protein